VTGNIGPEYQRLMDQIRSWITAGQYPVGAELPSITELEKITGKSRSVVREAIKRLQADGVLVGQQGKASFVKAMPAQAASERQSLAALSEQVAELQQQVREMAGHGEANADMTELLARVARIEVNLIDLYGKLGFDYPQGSSRDSAKAAVRRGRAR
jgi:DNA-binding GntR family transcriptional regulator